MPQIDSVVLFVIDGLRPDGLQQATTPHIDAFIAAGAHTYGARAVMPSATLPCHSSMFRGVTPERHGITTNTFVPIVRPVPSVTDVVHRAGRRTAAFYSWDQLRDLAAPGSLDYACLINNYRRPDGDREVALEAARVLADDAPAFTFVYFGYTDTAGHESGWMSADYLAAIAGADAAFGRVMEVLDGSRTAAILTADHGGHEQTHGTEMDEDMLIPWIIRAPGVAPGTELRERVNIVDNPATICALLGIAAAPEWRGVPVAAAVAGAAP